MNCAAILTGCFLGGRLEVAAPVFIQLPVVGGAVACLSLATAPTDLEYCAILEARA